VVVGKPCWILHLIKPEVAITYSKTRPSWKSKGQKLAFFYGQGQQMVQVHGVFQKSTPLMFPELERQPFLQVDNAVVPFTSSGIYIKWETWYLIRTTDFGFDHTS
jgi:hypothetical protein